MKNLTEYLAEAANMSKIKGTLGHALIAHKDEINKFKTKEELVKFLKNVESEVDGEAKDYLSKTVIPDINKSSLTRAQMYIYNIILAGEGMRV